MSLWCITHRHIVRGEGAFLFKVLFVLSLLDCGANLTLCMQRSKKKNTKGKYLFRYRIFTSSLRVKRKSDVNINRPEYPDSTDRKDSISHLISTNVADD